MSELGPNMISYDNQFPLKLQFLENVIKIQAKTKTHTLQLPFIELPLVKRL